MWGCIVPSCKAAPPRANAWSKTAQVVAASAQQGAAQLASGVLEGVMQLPLAREGCSIGEFVSMSAGECGSKGTG